MVERRLLSGDGMAASATEAADGERDPRGALLHPAFGVALALLVLNDHVLKGSGLVPAAITGKLSDFAGLVVAPIALAMVVRARSRAAQLAVLGVVAAGFALTELSQDSADLAVRALRGLGLSRATLVADASDLWALAILPLPYALLRADRAPVSRAAPRVSLGLALLACVASPSPPPPGPPSWTTQAYLVNLTGTSADVRMAWTRALPDCSALTAPSATQPGLGRIVDPAIFGSAITFRLDPGDTVPLDEAGAHAAIGPASPPSFDAAFADGGLGAGATLTSCQLVLLRSETAPDLVVLLTSTTAMRVPANVTSSPFPTRSIELHETDDVASWTVGSAFQSAEAIPTNAPSTCSTSRTAMAWSAITFTTATIGALDVGTDGCVDIALDDETLARRHLFTCGVPRSMIPFAVGTVVDVVSTDAEHLTIREHAGTATLTLAGPSSSPLGVGPTSVTASDAEACNGERIGCGAFVVPLAFTLAPLETGDDPSGVVTHTASSLTTQFLVGRSEHVLLAMPGCPSGRDRPGTHVQLAVASHP